MRISVICPVLNEADFIGYSIMAALEHMHEFVYALDAKSSDGTRDLLHHIKNKYAHEKLVILEGKACDLNPKDMVSYNRAFNYCIEKASGEACWFLHPDMIVTNPEAISELNAGASLAWWTKVTSFARDFQTVITKGRTDKWKNIHAKKLGLHYFGGYGSQNEDFYFSAITGRSYKHHGDNFSAYPFQVANSGIKVNHYCELKPYSRRIEKMKLCLETQNPSADPGWIEDSAANHPRVTLENSCRKFGTFEFEKKDIQMPEVFVNYKAKFDRFKEIPTEERLCQTDTASR